MQHTCVDTLANFGLHVESNFRSTSSYPYPIRISSTTVWISI